jgi:GNAT superfamily N-acetyltransferase
VDQARLLDEISINATASSIMQLLDGWLLRASPSLPFWRSNCAIALVDEPGGSMEEVEAFFARHGQEAIVQVRDSMTELDTMLANRGYVLDASTDILVADAHDVIAKVAPPDDVELALHAAVDDGSIEAYGDVMGESEYMTDRIKAYGRMMRMLAPIVFAATAHVDGRADPVGIGFGVVERGWIGYYGIGTVEDARRRGVGTAIMRALTQKAVEHGASHAYLQVDHENAGAHAMYARIGFTPSYGYHYRRRP